MFQGHLSRLSPKQVIHGRFKKDRQAQKKARAPGSFLQSEPIVKSRSLCSDLEPFRNASVMLPSVSALKRTSHNRSFREQAVAPIPQIYGNPQGPVYSKTTSIVVAGAKEQNSPSAHAGHLNKPRRRW